MEKIGHTASPPAASDSSAQEKGETVVMVLAGNEERGDGQLRRTFTTRQIHIISLGGQIGAGLFISTGKILRDGGPASLLLGFVVACTCVWAVLQTVSEMTISFPVSGNYLDYANRFVDPSLAFAAGFSMWLSWTAVIAAEAGFFSTLINYWAENRVNNAVWYTLFLVLMLVVAATPNRIFIWFEYGASIVKFLALLVFMLVGLAMVLGAGPDGYVRHGETWQNGSASINGFKGLSNCLLLALMAVGDQTLTGFLAGEARTPRFSVAHAVTLVPIRIAGLFLPTMLLVGLLVAPSDPRLLGGSGIAASPFVISLDKAGITGLPDLLNGVILVAVGSIGAECVFIASRMLRHMAHLRLLPAWVAKVDRFGIPRRSILITYLIALVLTYLNLTDSGIEVYVWLVNIASTGVFLVWMIIGIISFRFRAALKAQNDPLFSEPHAWACTWWPFPPIWLLLTGLLYTGCSFYLALYPIGQTTPTTYAFFQYMIGILLIVGVSVVYKLVMRTQMVDPKMADLQTGRRPLTEEDIKMIDDYYAQPKWKRVWSFLKMW